MTSQPSNSPPVEPPEDMALLVETYLSGVKYYQFAEGALPVDPGMSVELVREPDNPYDARAIEVYTPDGDKLGYLPRRRNKIPARLMDAGWQLQGRIEKVATARSDTGRRRENEPRPSIELSIFVPRKGIK